MRTVAWRGIKGEVLADVPMKRYTSMRVGGPVSFLVYPTDERDVIRAVRKAAQKHLPVRFFGNGTNVIVRDEGLDMVVIRPTRIRHLRHRTTSNGAVVDVSAGIPLRRLIRDCAEKGLSGLEKLFGIPGTVGGAIKMNAGSFGAWITDPLIDVTYLDTDGKERTTAKKHIGFGYRTSSFGKADCILSARFELAEKARGAIMDDIDYVFTERSKRHPMEYPSAGSIFKNRERNPTWKYIDEAGLRGVRIGNAGISEKHSNFIVNLGGATAADVVALIRKVKKEVRKHSGVMLEEEIELWGFDG